MGTFLIQGRHGTKGNFETVVPASHGGGLAHLWRNNDNTSYPWNGPFCFGGAARYTGTSLIQSNYGSPGNLELLAVDDGGAPSTSSGGSACRRGPGPAPSGSPRASAGHRP